MKIIVIGLGSMGKRRIRLLQKIQPDDKIVGVDTNEERIRFVRKEYGIMTYNDLEEALKEFKAECAVVSTAPLSHGKIINRCLEAGLHVFTEINLVDDRYAENIELAKKNSKVLFLSSTFLYRDEIRYIQRELESLHSDINYSYHIGQYLPDWHPWENFQDFFVGNKKTNGCREIFAIELPWLIKLFGEVKSFYVVKSKNTSLNIDYMDNYLLILEHEGGNKGTLAVDVMSRKAVRNLEIFGEELYLSWDGSPTGLKKYDYENKTEIEVKLYNQIDTLAGYSTFVIENAYQNELEAFLRAIEGKESARYSFEEDWKLLKMIDKFEEDET